MFRSISVIYNIDMIGTYVLVTKYVLKRIKVKIRLVWS